MTGLSHVKAAIPQMNCEERDPKKLSKACSKTSESSCYPLGTNEDASMKLANQAVQWEIVQEAVPPLVSHPCVCSSSNIPIECLKESTHYTIVVVYGRHSGFDLADLLCPDTDETRNFECKAYSIAGLEEEFETSFCQPEVLSNKSTPLWSRTEEAIPLCTKPLLLCLRTTRQYM